MRAVVAAGSALAAAGAVHAAVNAALLRRPAPTATPHRVSVLIPMRDEAAHVSDCLTAVLGQDGVHEVLVLDDGSSDGTAALARALGVRVLTGAPLPAGWLGKPWACRQLADAADPTADVLVFLDADVRLRPGAVAATVGLLDTLDLVSPYPRQVTVTAAERLVQPLLQWSWLTFLPLRLAERSGRESLAAANGQLLAVRRAAYERAGGHAAVRAEVVEDVALLRAVKRAGGRGGVADGTELADCRMYDGWPALRDGYTKSLWSAFGSPAGAVGVTGLLALAYLVPPLAALAGSRIGLAGYAAGVTGRVVTARRTGGRTWPDALAHPVSVALFAGLTARSLRHQRAGTLTWKGRQLP
ncbi:MAG TPA: glycosyltransferase [Mycobacteriales bacterium]|nr:glycosyltransferase [Mycobacteriales bacterium]